MRNGNYGTRYTEGIRNKTAISKKKKKKKMVSTYIRARFGLISPKSKHEKLDLQKKSTPLTRARIFCGVYKVFENRKRYTT